jgi:hypothetical protein
MFATKIENNISSLNWLFQKLRLYTSVSYGEKNLSLLCLISYHLACHFCSAGISIEKPFSLKREYERKSLCLIHFTSSGLRDKRL